MRKSILALIAITPLLGACPAATTAVTATTGSVSDVAPDAMMAAKKGLIAAHSTHEAAAIGLRIAAQSGVLHGTDAAKAKDILDQSEAYLTAADNLVALGDAQGIEAKISLANTLSAQVQALIGK